MKKILTTTALLTTTLLFPAMTVAGAATEQEILQKLENLTRKVVAQQKDIESLKAQLADSKAKMAENSETIEKVEAHGGSSAITLANKAIDQLKIKSDLRLRYEHRDRERDGKDDDTRNRWRSRVRLGGVWKNKAEDWEVGIGLASGGSDATSTNYTWSDNSVFETSDIRLDYAYAKHSMGTFSTTAGQHKNPYKKSWLYWDGDIRPTGLTVQYGDKGGPFVTAGGYAVSYDGVNNGNTAMLYAGQVGWNTKIDNMKLLVAGGVQFWDSVVSSEFAPNDDYDYTIGDLYAKLTMPAGDAKLSFYGQLWNNFNADGEVGQGVLGGSLDPEEETMGWVLGADVKINNMKLKASYAQVEADSLFGDITDADFGTGMSNTDIEGFKLGASYSFSKNWSMGVTAQFFEALERDMGDEVALYQVDMKYKF